MIPKCKQALRFTFWKCRDTWYCSMRRFTILRSQLLLTMYGISPNMSVRIKVWKRKVQYYFFDPFACKLHFGWFWALRPYNTSVFELSLAQVRLLDFLLGTTAFIKAHSATLGNTGLAQNLLHYMPVVLMTLRFTQSEHSFVESVSLKLRLKMIRHRVWVYKHKSFRTGFGSVFTLMYIIDINYLCRPCLNSPVPSNCDCGTLTKVDVKLRIKAIA